MLEYILSRDIKPNEHTVHHALRFKYNTIQYNKMSFMQIPTVDSMRKSMQVKTQEYKPPAKPTPE